MDAKKVRDALQGLHDGLMGHLAARADAGEMSAEVLQAIKEHSDFLDILRKESDRACALMAAAYLDERLQQAIQARLCAEPKALEALLGNARPLSSFSARIDMALLLGAISREAHRDLHLLRGLRNEFAHTSAQMTFESPRARPRCLELSGETSIIEGGVRSKFMSTMGSLSVHIAEGLATAARPAQPPPYDSENESERRDRHRFTDALLQGVGWVDNPIRRHLSTRDEEDGEQFPDTR